MNRAKAAAEGHSNIVQLIVECTKNRNPNFSDKDLNPQSGGHYLTPLHYAAMHGHVEIVKFLVEHLGTLHKCRRRYIHTLGFRITVGSE